MLKFFKILFAWSNPILVQFFQTENPSPYTFRKVSKDIKKAAELGNLQGVVGYYIKLPIKDSHSNHSIGEVQKTLKT